MDCSGDGDKHYQKAVKMGLVVAEEVKPELYIALHDLYKGFNVARSAGYQFSTGLPIGDIIHCYNTYYYDGTLVEFIDLIRACEKIINERNTNSNRDKS